MHNQTGRRNATAYSPIRSIHTLPARSLHRGLTVLFCGLVLAADAVAQDVALEVLVPPPGTVQELILDDSSVLYGRVREAGDPFTFRLISGAEITIAVADVRSLELVAGSIEGSEFWPEDPNRTRLFFGPTARTVGAGEGYLAVYELFIPFVAFGVTDRLLLSAGTPLYFGQGSAHPFWFAPKFQLFGSDRTSVALGALAVRVESEDLGLLYGVLTRGGPRAAVSIGVGYGYHDSDLASRPAVMFGGEFRGRRVFKLISENYLFPGGAGVLSVGPRFFGERLSADLGLAIPIDDGDVYAFPLVNFVWNF